MSDGSSTRPARQARPALEGLESRQLLSTAHKDRFGNWHNLVIHDKDLSRWQRQHTNYIAPSERRYEYTTQSGAKVTITLYGAGQIRWGDGLSEGTKYDPVTDTLDIRFQGTNAESGIVGTVHGGNGRAKIRSMVHGDLPINSISGVGSSLLRVVNLKSFDLVPGGRINLAGGVQTFLLNSAAHNTQISLREIPESVLNPDSGTSTTSNGVTLGFAVDLFGAQTLTSTSGEFLPGANLLPTNVPTKPNKPLPPPGVVAVINHVNGMDRQTGVGNPWAYGYDPNTDSLVRFEIQYVPGPTPGSPGTFVGNATTVRTGIFGSTGQTDVGATLGRYNGKLVVLVSNGDWMYGFDALDGSSVGVPVDLAALKTPAIPANAMANPSRLGNVDSFTVIGDPNAGNSSSSNPADKLGLLQIIDVTRSLDTGNIVAVGTPFASSRDFGLSGGFTGVPGLSTLFSAGGAYFDTYQPFQSQLGVASLVPAGSKTSPTFSASARNALTSGGSPINAVDLHGQTNTTVGSNTYQSLNNAMGSINLNLGIVTSHDATTNTVTLFSPSNWARRGTITLKTGGAQALSGLTSIFYPDIRGSALVDVQGNMQSFRANDTMGLILNDTGNLNLAKINSAVDTTIFGAPFGHAQIPHRQNVLIVSTRPRSVGTRDGVTLLPSDVKPVGPLTLPTI